MKLDVGMFINFRKAKMIDGQRRQPLRRIQTRLIGDLSPRSSAPPFLRV
ncbi:hypothetical protein RISK_000148 [Rhodopirellula islandica]|uniref:Uncharacterized protein n=1 Tax=Rhodopirellula islandica TaxID=595434 RepID=A0A0J1BMR6_RHOIS|nr:hypothetical protein RISK_000148 [Rhodopirellula islandica]